MMPSSAEQQWRMIGFYSLLITLVVLRLLCAGAGVAGHE